MRYYCIFIWMTIIPPPQSPQKVLEKLESCAFLVGMENEAAALNNGMAIPERVKHSIIQ